LFLRLNLTGAALGFREACRRSSGPGKLACAVRWQSEGRIVDDLTQQVVNAAQQAVNCAKSRPGGELDFTEASLSIVEEMLAEAAQFAADLRWLR
jgi:hypothetical protein